MCRHGDEVARAVEVRLLGFAEVIKVLPDEPFQRNVVELHLLLAYEVEQQVERTLKDVQTLVVVGGGIVGGRFHQLARAAV